MAETALAIEVDSLTKDYRIYRSSADMVREWLFRSPRHDAFRALDGVTFRIARGEVLGVMGPNGAGKSTLLKIITGTLAPTSGSVRVHGRVSAILELGTGFSPHKTGRENIEMGCLVLGMKPREIRAKMDEIIAFSELESFIDRPFHTFSSGMQARLTFAVAISPNPDVLIVDEALAVGDARFQQKCFGRIRAMRQAGTSILLVSHDDNTIATFCDRAIILIQGRVMAEGPPARMVPEYLRLMAVRHPTSASDAKAEDSDAQRFVAPAATGEDRPGIESHGDGRAEIVGFELEDEEGRATRRLRSGRPFRFRFRIRALVDLAAGSPAFAIRDRRATTMFGVSALTRGIPVEGARAGATIECLVSGTMWLAHGRYGLAFGLGDALNGNVIVISDQSVFFDVVGPHGNFTTSSVNLDASFEVRRSLGGASP